MNRTSFVGALAAVALGAVLAFAVQGSPRQLDLHVTGMIILIAGLADLVIRFMVADSPLLSSRAAAVAAVVEPIGEPVLDVFGNPVTPAAQPAPDQYAPERYPAEQYPAAPYAGEHTPRSSTRTARRSPRPRRRSRCRWSATRSTRTARRRRPGPAPTPHRCWTWARAS